MNRYLSEIIGTFFLVFNGCGAVAVNNITGGTIGHLGISLVFGFTVMVMIYSVGNISGAHLNPAVSLGFFLVKKLKWQDTLLYILSQFCGALGAGFVLIMLFPQANTIGVTQPADNLWVALMMEVILTMLLMFVILNVSTGHMEKGIMAGVAVGGTVALAALFGGPVSGASMNPARSLGPAIATLNLNHLWIYFIGPVLGVIIASPFCKWIQGKECCREDSE
ncbi:MAG: aquaporin [Spirochaetes bacterium]|nr:aquaporin [Spirochaetota bacterium]